MRLGKSLLGAILLTISCTAANAPLQVRLTSWSVMFRPATYKPFSLVYKNEVTSLSPSETSNGELALSQQASPSHAGTFLFTDGTTLETFPLPFGVDLPLLDDDGNGVYDLLEYDLPTSARTTGTYETPDGDTGTFTADWSKAAGSYTGTCKITFDDLLGRATFTHPIEIYEYRSNYSPTPSGTNLHSQITLTRQGAESQTLAGDLTISVSGGDVYLVSTNFVDQLAGVFSWINPDKMGLDRTEFYLSLFLDDGTPEDPALDFRDWLLVIKDVNDTDGDGIPDLVDPPTQVSAPHLDIVKTQAGIRILVHGDMGVTYTLEDSAAIFPAVWGHPTTVTIAADPQVVDLPAPSAPTFWRARNP